MGEGKYKLHVQLYYQYTIYIIYIYIYILPLSSCIVYIVSVYSLYIHTFIHSYIHTYIHTYIHSYIHTFYNVLYVYIQRSMLGHEIYSMLCHRCRSRYIVDCGGFSVCQDAEISICVECNRECRKCKNM